VKRTTVVGPIALMVLALALPGAARAQAQSSCGTWETMATPNPGYKANVLHSVAAIRGGTIAWAVGSTEQAGPPRLPLMLRMQGDSWSEEPVPMSGGQGFLLGVAISPKGHVWAVGARGDDFNRKPVAMRWRDGVWDVEVSPGDSAGPDPGPAGLRTALPVSSTAALYDVAAVLDDDVWVVGEKMSTQPPTARPVLFPTTTVPLIARWDGDSFKLYPIKASRSLSHHLRAIAAASPEDIWAVGYTQDASQTATATTYHFDGKMWTLVPNVAEELKGSRLLDVMALGPKDVWAVGDSLEGPVYIHWDGKQWTRDPGPPSGGPALTIDGVAADDLWASSGPEYFHYDGVAWSILSSPASLSERPPVAGGTEILRGTAAYDRCSVLAVGTFADGESVLTLAERLRPVLSPALTLTTTIAAPDTVRLTWTPPAPLPPAVAVVVERCDGGFAACSVGGYAVIQKLLPDVLTYDDAPLKPATYTYRIAAYSKGGPVYSVPVEATVPLPPSPVVLIAATVGPATVRLTWTPPDQRPTGIVVERCLGTAGMCSTTTADAYVPIANLLPDTLTYDDPALKPGVYTYRVAAFTKSWVVYSEPAEATLPSVTSPVTWMVYSDSVGVMIPDPK
jgi:hypothetical protein